MTPIARAALGALIALTAGCAEDLTPADAPTPDASPTGVETRPDGTYGAIVDATDEDEWIGFRFDSGVIGDGDDWDLRFRRFSVALNGGESGPGIALATFAPDITLADATQAPDDGWQTDIPDGDDMDQETDRVLDGWYDYDPASHLLSPKPGVWYVRDAVGDRYYALVVETYYDEAGTSGMIAVAFKDVAAPGIPPSPNRVDPPTPEPDPGPDPEADPDPDPPTGVEIDATDRMAWTHIRIDEQGALVPADDDDWDMAFQRSVIKMRSGVSGDSMAAARWAPDGVDYDALDAAPTTGYLVDDEVPAPGPPGSGTIEANPAFADWYDYDPATHQLSPKDRNYLVRAANGQYGRLRITDYDGGIYRVLFDAIPAVPETIQLTATRDDDWSAFDLTMGVEASAAGSWDLALFGVRIRTNGGTSGEGEGAAQSIDGDALGAFESPEPDGWSTDTMIPEPGPPGSGEFSGNAILSDWYHYNAMTHMVSPAARVFAVRLADGGLARMRVVDYTDGRITVEYQYAGAGRSSF